MKTTKDIAELFTNEMDRIAKGEVRKDVIDALDKCAHALIGLARLHMDYASNEWVKVAPQIPWLHNGDSASKPKPTLPPPQVLPTLSERQTKLKDQIRDCQEAMRAASPTLKDILRDKLAVLQVAFDTDQDPALHDPETETETPQSVSVT